MKHIRSAAALTALSALGLGLAATSSVATPVTQSSSTTATTTAATTSTAATTMACKTAQPTRSETPKAAAGLAFSREEERMARDLYAALAAKHGGARVLSVIARSEERHFAAVGALLKAYGIADPSAGRAAGSYAFPELQKLYDGWLAKGSTSLAAAYQVGIELEKRDISDLKANLADATQPGTVAVYGRLLTGSGRHLAAFERAASGSGAMSRPGADSRQGRAQGSWQLRRLQARALRCA